MPVRAHVVIIGYGNTLRGDDGLGCRAAERLARLDDGGRLRVIACHQLSVDHAELVADAELVIFIDASREGLPGELRSERVVASPADVENLMTHHLTPATLLALSRTLYGGTPEAIVVTVTGARFELSDELSPVVAAELPAMVLFVEGLVEKHAGRAEPWRTA